MQTKCFRKPRRQGFMPAARESSYAAQTYAACR
jgi:hypothetical protein